jgi:uncharacterized protein (DUF1501 family)
VDECRLLLQPARRRITVIVATQRPEHARGAVGGALDDAEQIDGLLDVAGEEIKPAETHALAGSMNVGVSDRNAGSIHSAPQPCLDLGVAGVGLLRKGWLSRILEDSPERGDYLGVELGSGVFSEFVDRELLARGLAVWPV